jgi:hypothetical protein
MEKDTNSANEAVEANNKINKILEDGKVHAPAQGNSEAETANLQLQEYFRSESQESDEGLSPAQIVTPQ